MSDEVIIDNKQEETPKALTLSVSMEPGKLPDIAAPGNGKLYDLPICLYLLEAAKDAIKAHNARVQMEEMGNKLVVAPHGLSRVRGILNGKKH